MSKNFKKTEEKKQKINFENTTKKLKKRKSHMSQNRKKIKKKKLNFPIFSFLRRSHRSISSKTFTFGNRFENFKGAN